MKQYAVEILEKTSHGIYGKEIYANWCLSEKSKKGACSFASEIIAGMTWREILAEKYGEDSEMIQPIRIPFGCKMDDTIGYEYAEKHFSYKAILMK